MPDDALKPDRMTPPFRYKAFISYSWADRREGDRLLRAIEHFTTPRSLVGLETPIGPTPRRLSPVFKDREEESAGANLRDAVETALENSEFLIVICSPNSVRSKWVPKEVAYFRARRDPSKILPFIIDGEPLASEIAGREAEECFPSTLRFHSDITGSITDQRLEMPLAADARRVGDGVRIATLKIIAAMLGVGLDALVRRVQQRRTRRLQAALAGASLIAVAMAGLALFAVKQRDEARLQRNIATEQRAIAEKERDTATSALNFLVSIFQIANPTTENPKNITALTILGRGADKIETDLQSEPEVQAKLYGALGGVYYNLGDFELAEKLLQNAVSAKSSSSTERIRAELQLSLIALKRRKLVDAGKALDEIAGEAAAAESARVIDAAVAREFRCEIFGQKALAAYLGGKVNDAINLYTSAMTEVDEESERGRIKLAELSTNRGMLLVAANNVEEGLADLDRAHAAFLKRYGPDHLLTAKATHNIAYAEFQKKNYADAVDTMKRALQVYEKVLDRNHPDLANALKFYGTILMAAGRPKEAIAPLKSAVDGFAGAFGAAHYNVGYSLVYLAEAYAYAGDPVDARNAIIKATSVYKENFEPGSFDDGDLMVYRAIVAGSEGDRASAEKLCARGLAILKTNLGETDPYFVEMQEKCARAQA
jgi:tetratricopeptide (TPR) repeat protein